jgi:hypothetical protein
MMAGSYVLEGNEAGAPVLFQVFEDAGKHWMGSLLPGKLSGGTYSLIPRKSAEDGTARGVSVEPDDRNLIFHLDGSLFTKYRVDAGAKPFLYPLIGPTGDPFTRAYPMEDVSGEDRDHPHQRSFWFTHGNVNGIDFWSEQEGHGTIRETSRPTLVAGPLLARLRTTDDWLDPSGKKILEDERVLTVYRTVGERTLDFEITLKATAGAVTFGDTKEGTFGLRVASSMDVTHKQGGRITNAEGLTDDKAWGKASPWVDYTGPVHGKPVGIAILNHPSSFRYPTTWHVRTYGLFAANPFGWHDFGVGKSGEHVLADGQTIRFAYRVILHEGDTASAGIGQAFEAYSRPPGVELIAQ